MTEDGYAIQSTVLIAMSSKIPNSFQDRVKSWMSFSPLMEVEASGGI